MEKETVEEHPSYGMIGFSRMSIGGSGANLFGSSIKHGQVISVSIRHAQRRRDLSHDWYYGQGEIVEVLLSPTQFAEAITCMNVGDGVPCTINHIAGKGVESCPDVSFREKYEQEFKADVSEASAKVISATRKIEEILSSKTVTKTACKSVLEDLYRLKMLLQSSMPFVQQSFNEALDKTVTAAKGEVEHFILNKVMSLGLDALQAQVMAANALPPDQPTLTIEQE